MRPLLSAILLLLAACAPAPPARAEPPVWLVEDADSRILIFGSFHLLPAGVDWRPEALDLALVQADDLWFEVPVETAVNPADAQAVLAQGSLPDGRSLSAMLSEEGARRLVAISAEAGLPFAAVDRLQPWYAETILGLAIYRRQGALSEEGVERQIERAAPPGARRVALESAVQQIAFLASGSQAEQVASLEHSLRLFKEDPGYFRRLLGFWLNGDVAGLDREVIDEMRRTAPQQYESLIVARNRAWVPRIRERLSGSGHTVVVVGVGHLVGPDSVPALLRAQGVQVFGP